MTKNQTIHCNVISCKFNDCNNLCNLDEIKVSCDCNKKDVTDKRETICNSFKKTKEKE